MRWFEEVEYRVCAADNLTRNLQPLNLVLICLLYHCLAIGVFSSSSSSKYNTDLWNLATTCCQRVIGVTLWFSCQPNIIPLVCYVAYVYLRVGEIVKPEALYIRLNISLFIPSFVLIEN